MTMTTTTTPIDWTAAGTAAAHATRASLGDEPVDMVTARDVMEHHLFYADAAPGDSLRSLDMDARRAALDTAFAAYRATLASLALPANSDALSARLREYGADNPCNTGFALVCDMPDDVAVLYAARVRELPDTRAGEVADLLSAYRAALGDDDPGEYPPRLPLPEDRCNADEGCDELATMFEERDGSGDRIYCAEHAPAGCVPLHSTPAD